MIETIEKRLKEYDEQFNKLKEEVMKAEDFAHKGKEELLKISGAYKALMDLKEKLSDEDKVIGESNE